MYILYTLKWVIIKWIRYVPRSCLYINKTNRKQLRKNCVQMSDWCAVKPEVGRGAKREIARIVLYVAHPHVSCLCESFGLFATRVVNKKHCSPFIVSPLTLNNACNNNVNCSFNCLYLKINRISMLIFYHSYLNVLKLSLIIDYVISSFFINHIIWRLSYFI